ncbi:GspE/PulE family protein [Parvularcula maris]|uniref:GspE/PulE family protein n=1 Tax=Parvularcula maris TaxID=2965077 RepID=A0A9X2LB71_9PROT|nr:GspE/PulE family protein [Parvularcula maris]MCQ8186501.1 GspE/PulE family protein [Parvularcula maris]
MADGAFAGEGAGGETSELIRVLEATGALSTHELQRIETASKQTGQDPAAVILKLGLLSDDAMARHLSQGLGLPLLGAADMPDGDPLDGRVPMTFLEDAMVVPIKRTETSLQLAMVDPTDRFTVEAMEAASGLKIDIAVIAHGDAEAALDLLKRGAQPEGEEDVSAALLSGTDDEVARRLIDTSREVPVIRTVNTILSRAVTLSASDIHLEPYEQGLVVRYRIDGVLYDQQTLPLSMGAPVVSRLKLVADLDIAERRMAQDGRIRTVITGRDLDLRVATLPTLHGEAMTIRLLRQDEGPVGLSELGMSEVTKARLRDVLRTRHGIFLSTGATGSGKTTTLYALLRETDSINEKVVTVEDPIEYQLDRIAQVQVKPEIGLDFARVLRAIVRQDPDVIMIGETRDIETATIAVQAALTGHLVYSTLHTNDAASAVTRLTDMGVDDYLLASTLNGVVGQRLVRRLCEHCREPYEPSKAVRDRFGLEKGGRPLYRAVGCKHCQNRGYQGRTGIFELLVVDDALRNLMLSRTDATALAAAAKKSGMRTLQEEGVDKALMGITSLEEVVRVTRVHG